MSKDELAENFTKIYEEINLYTIKAINVSPHKKMVDKGVLLSECYIHLVKYKDDITNINILKSYSKKFIKSNLGWYYSIIFKEKRVNWCDLELNEEITEDFNEYLIDSDYINDLTIEFYNTLETFEKRLFDIYYKYDKQTSPAISKHLGVCKMAAYYTLLDINVVNEKYRTFIKQYISR